MSRRNRLKRRFRNRSNCRHKGRPPKPAGQIRIGGQEMIALVLKPGNAYTGPPHDSCGGVPKYVGLMIAAYEKAKAAGQIGKGDGLIMPILHDSWCAFLAGRGQCNCNPEVRVHRVPLQEEK